MSVYYFFNNIYNIVRRVCNETISTLSGKMSLFVVFRFNINDNCSLSIPMFFVMMSFKLPNVIFCLLVTGHTSKQNIIRGLHQLKTFNGRISTFLYLINSYTFV